MFFDFDKHDIKSESYPELDRLADLLLEFPNMKVELSGHTDDGTISKAVEHMTGKQSRHLRAAYKDAVPNIEIRSTVTCRECATTSELEVPLTADFFWFKS